ncbi:MAG: DEAD/DEAH box helicase, partial [Atopobiaceae bacterium]|nr:DEAD/DEAH box helicase [Atopobiaceae bacterium]
LAATAGVDLSGITSDELPFSLVPRLNAAGRMGETDVAFDLLMADDSITATELAARLETINTCRRDIETQLTAEAMAKAEATFRGGHIIVVSGEGWHEGVKGSVASRLVNRFHVPVILFTVADGIAKGSGRSVGSVDLFRAVEQAADLTVRFGGHAGAVGVTIEESMIDAFRERMERILSALDPLEFESKGEVAAIADLDEVDMDSIASLEVLQPFGQGNKKPLIASCGVLMRNRSCVGADGDHLRFNATNGTASIPAIMFRTPDIERASAWEGAVDLVYEPVIETWQGRSKPKLMVKDIIYRDCSDPDRAEQGVADGLFDHAAEILARDEYASIAESDSFNTKAVGVTFEGRQGVAERLAPGEELFVMRDPDNPYDPNAIALVTMMGEQVGFLRRQIAAHIAPLMDGGVCYRAEVLDVTGGGDRSVGVNVHVSRDLGAEERGVDSALEAGRAMRGRLERLGYAELTDALRERLIGFHSLLPAQELALAKLESGRSCLCVMATGRGKSLIFHIHAAREAILNRRASVFVYPLRALVADQSFHLSEAFEELGLSVRVLTGESSADERQAIFEGIADGSVDLVLTTPEFFTIHSERFAQSGRIGFVVVDEAHHAGAAKSGNRSSYLAFPETLERLGRPRVLAVSATADDSASYEICRLLGISTEDVVVDDSVRTNLHLLDERELRDRDARLVSIVSSGEKCVIYVNSRDQSVMIARNLRKALPDLGHRISFYNASLTREERDLVEDAFRAGELSCIVSTSAFGEGVNLPDIRNVVLYHMPFGAVEFNQMSGRAGRDGASADIHLLFNARDARINEHIIASSAPGRDELVVLYKTLKTLAQGSEEDGSIASTNAEIATSAIAVNPRTTLDEHSVSSGVGVFRELGFLTTSGFSSARRIHMVDSPNRMELDSSVRYQEGLRTREEFEGFREWALCASADEMLSRLNRPITPHFGTHV